MKYLLVLALASVCVLPLAAQDTPKPVRMGSGIMTFETVPGWGLRPDGKSAIGPTHGSVVIDKAGNIYTSAQAGVFVFSPDGKVIHSYLGKDYSNIHDMEIRDEEGGEFIYGARNANAEGIKFSIRSGEIVLRLGFPKESGLNLDKFNPTAITVASNGDIFLSNGYASNHIFKFDKTGKYLMHFGSKGNELKQFNTAHGMTLDTRYEPARLLICDRNHKPKGRLLHYSLEGEFIEEVITGLGNPRRWQFRGTMFRFLTSMGGRHSRQEQHHHGGARAQRGSQEAQQLQHPTRAMDRRGLQRYPRFVLGQRGKPVRSGLERIRKNHEAGTRQRDGTRQVIPSPTPGIGFREQAADRDQISSCSDFPMATCGIVWGPSNRCNS